MWNDKKFDKAVAKLPALYSTENVKAKDKTIAMHLFLGGCDWWICEGDAKEGVLFGFANLNDWQDAEWGYVSIEEMKALKMPITVTYPQNGKPTTLKNLIQLVDIDLSWLPTRFENIPTIAKNVYGISVERPSDRELMEEIKIEGQPLQLDYAKMDFLNCFDCLSIAVQHPGIDKGECSEPKEGCKELLASLARDPLGNERIRVTMGA